MPDKERKKLNEELSNISQRLRKVIDKVEETGDVEILSTFPNLAEAKNQISDAKYIMNRPELMKKISKESQKEIKQSKGHGKRAKRK